MTSSARPDTAVRRACVVCGARLSTYNREDTCFTHTLEVPWKGPNTKPR